MRGQRVTRGLGVPGVLGVISVLSAAVSAVGFAVLSPPAESLPEYLTQFNAKYDTAGSKLDSCMTCHNSAAPSKEALNPYGTDFGASNHDFAAIEGKDSDGDGVTNLEEIKAETFPGDPNDKPM